MGKGDNPIRAPASGRKNPHGMPSTGAKQRSLLSFFTKMGVSEPKKTEGGKEIQSADDPIVEEEDEFEVELPEPTATRKSFLVTPQPSKVGIFSSDAPSPEQSETLVSKSRHRGRLQRRSEMESSPPVALSLTTSTKGLKRVDYAESSDSGSDLPRAPVRAVKRRRKRAVESEDEFRGNEEVDEGKNLEAEF